MNLPVEICALVDAYLPCDVDLYQEVFDYYRKTPWPNCGWDERLFQDCHLITFLGSKFAPLSGTVIVTAQRAYNTYGVAYKLYIKYWSTVDIKTVSYGVLLKETNSSRWVPIDRPDDDASFATWLRRAMAFFGNTLMNTNLVGIRYAWPYFTSS